MGPGPELRIAGAADAAGIEALMQASAAALFPLSYDPVQAASAVRHVARVDPMLLVDRTYFVLETDGDLVACGGWSRRGRPYMGSASAPDDDRLLDPEQEPAHVRAMYVRPDWTRRGLGRRILAACEAAAGAEGFSALELVATLPGVPLYQACGFIPTAGIEDIVLEDGVRLPCLAMSKVIDLA